MISFHDLSATTIDGKTLDLSQFKGKKVMVVNTASECGFTPQYATLQEMHQEFSGQNFVILGFPSNDFGKQEPGSASEIAEFCEVNYGVTFQLMQKVQIKTAPVDPVYNWLTRQEENGVADVEVIWNFQKFLIDEDGRWVKSIPHSESPASTEIIDWIQS